MDRLTMDRLTMDRLTTYHGHEAKVLMVVLERIWNSPGYKDCKTYGEVWDRVKVKRVGNELIALLEEVSDRI